MVDVDSGQTLFPSLSYRGKVFIPLTIIYAVFSSEAKPGMVGMVPSPFAVKNLLNLVALMAVMGALVGMLFLWRKIT